MNDEQRFDRTARTWLEDGPTRAPDRPVVAALAEVSTTSQERDLRVPWRFTDMPMLLRVAAAAIVIAVIGGGALFLLRPSDVPGVGVQPTMEPSPTVSASPSPSVSSVEAYVAARNAICDSAVRDTDPYKERYVGVFDGSLSDADRADWVAALDASHARFVLMIEQLDALEPPAVLAADDADIVEAYRQQVVLVKQVADRLRDHRDADAAAADLATEPLGDRIGNWEREHVLHNCP
jgi:hypothetical protein